MTVTWDVVPQEDGELEETPLYRSSGDQRFDRLCRYPHASPASRAREAGANSPPTDDGVCETGLLRRRHARSTTGR